MIAVQDIIDRVGIALNDEDNIRWTVEELLLWINDGASEIVIRRPPATAEHLYIALTSGTLQAVPSNARMLLDIVRGQDGYPISQVDRMQLDTQSPGWHIEPETDVIQHFTYDVRKPDSFYVYPPAIAGTTVEALLSMSPIVVTAATDIIEIDGQYLVPLTNYVLWRAMAKESEYGNVNLAVSYFQSFTDSIGSNNQMTIAVSPDEATPK